MIEVTLIKNGEKQANVFDIEDAETALFVGQTLWDDFLRENRYQGVTNGLETHFIVDGVLVKAVYKYRPREDS